MIVSPTVSFAPANLEVRVHLTPDDVNRGLDVIAESGEYYRSSHVQLDGKDAPNNIRVELRSLPGGTYVIRGLITDSAGRTRATARTEAIVVAADRDDVPPQAARANYADGSWTWPDCRAIASASSVIRSSTVAQSPS
jgi:hypothetical protein